MHLASHKVQSTGSKWLQMAPNGSKLLQITPNDYGGDKWIWQWPNIVPNGHKWSQMVHNYSLCSNIVQNGQIWSEIVLNGPIG